MDEGRTVFIRNVPASSDRVSILKTLSQYGKIEFCKMVMDKATGECKGSAFVKFEDKEVAESVIEKSKLAFIENDSTGDEKKPFTSSVKHSLLVKEEEMCDGGVYMDGKALAIFPAVSSKKLSEIQDGRERLTNVRNDKQNLYLLKEGMIYADSEGAQNVPAADLSKRLASYNGRKAKLKNPNFFISKTRLSLRNLPATLDDEKNLKKKVFDMINEQFDRKMPMKQVCLLY